MGDLALEFDDADPAVLDDGGALLLGGQQGVEFGLHGVDLLHLPVVRRLFQPLAQQLQLVPLHVQPLLQLAVLAGRLFQLIVSEKKRKRKRVDVAEQKRNETPRRTCCSWRRTAASRCSLASSSARCRCNSTSLVRRLAPAFRLPPLIVPAGSTTSPSSVTVLRKICRKTR